MGLDSNSPGDERSAGAGAEKAAAAGLKLVGDRGPGTGASGAAAAGAPMPGRPGPTSELKSPTGGPAPVRRGDRKSRRQVPLWLFGAMLALLLIGYGFQIRHTGKLEAEVVRLEDSLARAEARLESHRTHLLEIRGGVHDLSARLENLRALIDRDPTAAPAAPGTEAPVPSDAPPEPATP